MKSIHLLRRALWSALGLIVAALSLYVLLGFAGGAIARAGSSPRPPDGVTIWVEDNGVHTGLVLPKVAAGVDWRGDWPASDLRDPRFGGHGYVAIGWGDRGFFLETPRWRDLRPGVVVAAALGTEATLLHVEHVARPVKGDRVRSVVLRPDEYRALVRFVRDSRGAGAAIPGYGAHDAFYPATGRYDLHRTCNAWTGDALATAGVRVGRWTPFAATAMWWL